MLPDQQFSGPLSRDLGYFVPAEAFGAWFTGECCGLLHFQQAWSHHTARETPLVPLSAQHTALLHPRLSAGVWDLNSLLASQVFSCWIRILQRVPNSVIWLYRHPTFAVLRLLRAARKHGVDVSRFVFSGPVMPKIEHLKRLTLAGLPSLAPPTCGLRAVEPGCVVGPRNARIHGQI